MSSSITKSRITVNILLFLVISTVAIIETAYLLVWHAPVVKVCMGQLAHPGFTGGSSSATQVHSSPHFRSNDSISSSRSRSSFRVRSGSSSSSGGSSSGSSSSSSSTASGSAACAGLAPLRVIPGRDNPVWEHFESVMSGPVVHKWTQYFDVYDRYFSRYRNREVHFMEIGVQSGGSIELWKAYFGPGLHYYGVDINPYTKPLFEDAGPPSVKVFVGSQSNRTFWQADVVPHVPKLDILLDDGGHTMEQQIVTFEEMYQHVKLNGVYMVEDCATSYSASYGGGLRKPGTWIEYSKGLIDPALFADYYNNGVQRSSDLTGATMSISYYDQMVVFEKGDHMKAPASIIHGTACMETKPPTKDGGVDPVVLARFQEAYNTARAAASQEAAGG